MAIEMIGGMDALLAKLNAVMEATGRLPVAAPKGGTPAVDFAAALKESIAGVDASQVAAQTQAERFQVGDPKVTLEETMVSLAKANVDFQQLVQVRNKVVAAYHDIMNMQI